MPVGRKIFAWKIEIEIGVHVLGVEQNVAEHIFDVRLQLRTIEKLDDIRAMRESCGLSVSQSLWSAGESLRGQNDNAGRHQVVIAHLFSYV